MENKGQTCFIVTPIGGDNTDTRRAAEGVIDAVIIPSLAELGFKEEYIKVAHRMANAGSINKQLISRILEDDLVVVNLTNLNPNVMYELAVRHSVRKPVIQICEKTTKLPFDIIDERTIFYENDMKGVIELKDKFNIAVQEAIKEENPDNPIYRATDELNILKIVDPEEKQFSKYLLERLDSLESSIVNMNNPGIFNRKLQEFNCDIEVVAKKDCTSEEIIKNLSQAFFDSNINRLSIGPNLGNLKIGETKVFTVVIPKLDLEVLNLIRLIDNDTYKVISMR